MTPARVTRIAGGWGGRATSSPSCREAVIGALGEDRDLMARFARACSEGMSAVRELGLPVRRALVERRHPYETHGEQLKETLCALYDIAAELLPNSPGASLARLRACVQERDGEPANEIEAIEELVAEDYELLDKLLLAAEEEGPDGYVLGIARHTYLELHRRGQRWEPSTFSKSVRSVMASLCPPAWDEAWARSERRRALVYICSRAADGEIPDLPNEYAEVFEAEGARDPARFSAAVRALVVSALGVLRREGRLTDEAPASSDPGRAGDPGASSAA